MIHVQDVQLTDTPYALRVLFSDHQWHWIDLKNVLWGDVFSPLLNSIELFNQVKVDPDAETLVWPNGADLAPEFLYQHSRPI